MKKIIITFFSIFLLFTAADSAEASLSCSFNSCPSGGIYVLKTSDSFNAQAELPGQSNYSNYICCSGISGTSCSGGTAFLKLSAVTNAHVEENIYSNYSTNACLSPIGGETITCTYSATCAADEVCLASISSATNAHIGNCSSYSTKVCCKAATGTFNFYLSVNPPYGLASGQVTPGGSISTNVGVVLSSGTAQTVNLFIFSISPTEPTITASFSNNSCSPTCSRTMNIDTTTSTPTGDYTISICGTGGELTRCTVYGLSVATGGVEIGPPSITTNDAISITENSATLKGTLNGLGNNATFALVWFEYKKSTDTVWTKACQTTKDSVPVDLSCPITGLSPNTTYYFKAFAKNGGSW